MNGKLSLNFTQIDSLNTEELPANLIAKVKEVKKVFLSHNNLVSLKGIEAFEKLTHLSVASNYIQNIDEFAHIKYPE